MESTDRESEELESARAEAATEPVEPDAAEPEDSDEPLVEAAVPARPRTVPRFGVFIGVGVIMGLVLALVLFFVLPTDGSSSSLTGLVYLAVLVTPFTALLGGLAAVLFERRSLRK